MPISQEKPQIGRRRPASDEDVVGVEESSSLHWELSEGVASQPANTSDAPARCSSPFQVENDLVSAEQVAWMMMKGTTAIKEAHTGKELFRALGGGMPRKGWRGLRRCQHPTRTGLGSGALPLGGSSEGHVNAYIQHALRRPKDGTGMGICRNRSAVDDRPEPCCFERRHGGP